jgi:hypothetical protein
MFYQKLTSRRIQLIPIMQTEGKIRPDTKTLIDRNKDMYVNTRLTAMPTKTVTISH